MTELTKKEKIMLIWILDERLKEKSKILEEIPMASYDRDISMKTCKQYEEIRAKLKSLVDADDSVVDWH